MRKPLTLLMMLLAALACNAPTIGDADLTIAPAATATAPQPTSPPTAPQPEPATPLPTLPAESARVSTLVEAVSEERLMADVRALASIPTRHVNSVGASQAASLIEARFREAGLSVEVQTFPAVFDEQFSEQRNVIATLPGRETGQIVVGAHYDSRTIDITDAEGRAPGANDNASGVAALLEIARLLAGSQPQYTITLVAFAGEEVGMLGSRHYVSTVDISQVQFMLALDTIAGARETEDSIRAFAGEALWPATLMALHAERAVPGFEVLAQPTLDRPGRYSDHVPFFEAGRPVVRLIETVEDPGSNHSAEDTVERMSPAYLRRATQLALAAVANAAYGPPPPSGLAVEGDTLSWQPVEGGVGYVVLALDGERLLWWRAVGPVTSFSGIGNATALTVASVGPGGEIGLFAPGQSTVIGVGGPSTAGGSR